MLPIYTEQAFAIDWANASRDDFTFVAGHHLSLVLESSICWHCHEMLRWSCGLEWRMLQRRLLEWLMSFVECHVLWVVESRVVVSEDCCHGW